MQKRRSKGAKARKHKYKTQRGRFGRSKEASLSEQKFWRRQSTQPSKNWRPASQGGK